MVKLLNNTDVNVKWEKGVKWNSFDQFLKTFYNNVDIWRQKITKPRSK